MLHPVGSLPPNVYWRRRALLMGFVIALVLLIALTSYVACSPSSKIAASASTSAPPSTAAPRSASTVPSSARPDASSSPAAGTSGHAPSTSKPPASSAPPVPCAAGALKVAAATGAPSYKAGADPVLFLQVTNAGPVACTENLADSNVELRVYNGASRVWGSHDCQIEPGTNVQTLTVGQPVRLQIVWSGLSSQPACAGERQRVGAGTYTLYALLGGQQGTAATFAITQS